MIERRRRITALLLTLLISGIWAVYTTRNTKVVPPDSVPSTQQTIPPAVKGAATRALDALETLEVRGRAPKTNYAREQFGAGWAEIGGCDMRNYILQRDLAEVRLGDDGCTVLSGTLRDPYTGSAIPFKRGAGTSAAVQIDHVVALSDAWQKGAQQMDEAERATFANDPLNLLAVDGPTNQKKGDGDAATWLPPDRTYRCRYVARQIAVKQTYQLWVTEAERAAMKRVLTSCSDQILPLQMNPESADETTRTQP